MPDPHSDKIVVLDFGARYTRLLARRIREAGVYCEVWAWNHDADEIVASAATGFVLTADSDMLADSAAHVPQAVLDAGVPVLGVGYGMTLLTCACGGNTTTTDTLSAPQVVKQETVTIATAEPLFHGIDAARSGMNVQLGQGVRVQTLPAGFTATAHTESGAIAAMSDNTRNWHGLQFHPELEATDYGGTVLDNFLGSVCGCGKNWTSTNIIADQLERIRQAVGNERVLLALSGGVDSAVVAAMLHQAIGTQLSCVFVDTGLLRWQEGDEVMAAMAEHMGVSVTRVNAAERYFSALAGVTEPERKRKIIGNLFIEIFDEEAAKLARTDGDVQWLAQGTIYPDIIESVAVNGQAVKSHHNVGGLPEHMNLRLVEPLRELFKDEVRRIGMELGLPSRMVYRHPFPGPGLGVRVPGEVKPEYVQTLARADAIFIEELRRADLYDTVSQAFAVFVPTKSVGVVDDARTYGWGIALRAIETVDFMSARWARLPYELLAHVSDRIINEIDDVSRVVYDISGKPPATIEWE